MLGQIRYYSIILLFFLYLPFVAYSGQMENLRNTRYCEIIFSQKRLNFAVYNTIGLNDCPAEIWKKISVADIKKETGSFWVFLNGPRYWVIDGLTNSKIINPEPRTLGGLAMRQAGILHLSLLTIIKGNSSYNTHRVDRQTTWVYKANAPVYELINPNGEVFVMQSYSIQKTPQTETSLPELGAQLKLPAGWRFRTGILHHDTLLKAIDNKATVVQDEFLNTYQQASHDFLD